MGRGDPKMVPSHGYAKPYNSAMPWHEGLCEHGPWSRAPPGKAVPCPQPTLLLGKPQMR